MRSFVNKYLPYAIIAIAVLIAILPWFSEGLPSTDDFRHHITKFWAIHENGSEWQTSIYSGWPLTHFYHSLPYYVAYLFYFLPAKTMLKTSIVLSFILVGILMYLASMKLTRNKIISVAATIFYIYLPIHFEYAYLSGSVSRLWSYAIVPIVIALYFDVLENKNKGWFAISFAALMLTNLNQAFTMVPILLAILLLNFSTKRVKNTAITAIFALLLISFWFVPLVLESSESSAAKTQVFGGYPGSTTYTSIFSRTFELSTESRPFYIGYSLIILAALSLLLTYPNKKTFIITTILGIFLTTNASVLKFVPFSSMYLYSIYFFQIVLVFACIMAATTVYAATKINYGKIIAIAIIAAFIIDVYPAVTEYRWVDTTEQFINSPQLITALKWVGAQPGQFRVYTLLGETPYIWHNKFEIGTEWMGYREGALNPIRKITDNLEVEYRRNPRDKTANDILEYFGTKYVVGPCGEANVAYSLGPYCVYDHAAKPLVFTPEKIEQGSFEYSDVDVNTAYVKECSNICGKNNNATITNILFEPKEITFKAQSQGAYVLVASSYLEKHFSAYIDGKETPIIPAWPKYMLIYVPSGNHDISIKYGTHTTHLIFGLISIITLAGIVYLELRKKPTTENTTL